jgi:hypothetical protein
METRHPWQKGPTELLSHALDHLHRPSEFDRRIAFLLLDIGVETLLRAYLELPAEVNRTRMDPDERARTARGDLDEIIRGVKAAAGPRLRGVDLGDVEYYHAFRIQLYHQGHCLPVSAETVRDYAYLAVTLLRRLFGVDLEPLLVQPPPAVERRKREAVMVNQIRQVQTGIDLVEAAIDSRVRAVAEALEPAFLMPSFHRSLGQWLDQLDQNHLRTGLRSFYADRGTRKPDPTLARAILVSMPPALQRFVTAYAVDPAFLAFELARAHSTTETLLVLADSALGLSPKRNTAGIYWIARLLKDEDPLVDWSFWERGAHSTEEPLVAFRDRCEEALTGLKQIRAALDASLTKLYP